MLDHLAIARGYGLAIALFGWALLASLDFAASGGRNSLLAAGVLSGLSIATNLTILWPVCGLWLMLGVFEWRNRRVGLEALVNGGIGPGAVLCALIIALPFSWMDPKQHYYFGASSLGNTLDRILITHFDRDWWGTPGMIIAVSFTLLAAAAIAGGLILGYRRRNLPALLCSGTLAASMLAVVAAHVLVQVPYPIDRTSLWIVFMIEVCVTAAVAQLPDRPWMRHSVTVILLIFTATQVAQYNPHYSFEWRMTANLAELLSRMHDAEASRGRKFQVNGNWDYAFPVNYYRERWKLANMAEFVGGGPKRGADYYIFTEASASS